MKRFCFVIGIIASCFFCVCANAQVQEIEQKLSTFTSISVSDGFDVTLRQADKHSVVLTVDKVLADYVKVEVKSRTLCLEFDNKAVPKELKKQYSGRNGLTPTLKAVVYVQSLEGIELKEDAKLGSLSAFEGGSILITATNNSMIRDLELSGTSIKVAVDKKSSATLRLKADNLDLNAGGSSALSVTHTSKNLTVNAKGSSNTVVNGDAESMVVNGDNSSKVKVSGKSGELVVRGQRTSEMELTGIETPRADIALTGSCTVMESASDELRVDLAGGSKLYFDGQPEIEIVKVKSSTLMHYSDMQSR